jgi:hypothetical protein
MLNITAPPIPEAFIASKSFVIPSLEKLLPNQCHHTQGWYPEGGAWKDAESDCRVSASAPCPLPSKGQAISKINRNMRFILVDVLKELFFVNHT